MYDAADNSSKSYEVAISSLRERLEKSKVVIGDCTLYCEKAEFIVPTLAKVDALVTDPPYGIGEAAGANKSRGNIAPARDYGNDDWDNEPVSAELLDAIRAKAKWQVIFGGNYYDLPPTKCWLVWDKINGENDFADCELAWTNIPKAVRRLRFMWNGMLRAHGEPRGDHPTQKPIGVMKWCIEHLPADVETILDPFMGSGTTLVAAVKLGKRGIGIERERKYFEIACRRIEQAYAQGDLFVAAPSAKPKQLDLEESLSGTT
jgi:site-specific DNA-methyltransferase (adenine-specific)/modification methylase